MAPITRVLGTSLLTGWLVGGVTCVLFQQHPDYLVPTLILACVGAVIGAVAGAAREIATALRERPGA